MILKNCNSHAFYDWGLHAFNSATEKKDFPFSSYRLLINTYTNQTVQIRWGGGGGSELCKVFCK